ncbi:MAG: triose-phosphate isomerase [Bacteroidetes bacterium HGW-Bacteroidetes-1]|nr:MAG: triose-phosphate isomerase [Bacteroidetes bacterium HGW-Bacteroidetes-1]
MRKKVVAGNWKMNLGFEEAEELIEELIDLLEKEDIKPDVIICPPYPYLEMASDYAQEARFKVGAQNICPFESGAYTGEVSASMLSSMEVTHCIIGHSERRKYFGEDDKMLTAKVNMALIHGITPIFCVGESLPERESEKHFEIVRRQVRHGLFHLDTNEFAKVIIAYEPVWAIGTGITASPAQAAEMHAYIRTLIVERYGEAPAEETIILYGGSCTSKNAAELFAQPGVDGGLVGGASLIADEFVAICKQA